MPSLFYFLNRVNQACQAYKVLLVLKAAGYDSIFWAFAAMNIKDYIAVLYTRRENLDPLELANQAYR